MTEAAITSATAEEAITYGREGLAEPHAYTNGFFFHC